MNYRQQELGRSATFLLPSLKLKRPRTDEGSLEDRVHTFLMDNFGGYTAAAGNIFGYWKDESGKSSYGEHRQFTIALVEDSKLPSLKNFLADLSAELNEDCLYLTVGDQVVLIYPE